uniref:Uncharacterized protein n=1 Tax=Burkholderia sp. (strain CCGE1003) TaxID=640512 RepID=E1TIL7_BURSG
MSRSVEGLGMGLALLGAVIACGAAVPPASGVMQLDLPYCW